MTLKTVQTYMVAAECLLVLDWFILLARSFGRGWAAIMKPIFTVVNFPWSFFFFAIEDKANPWWSETFGKSSMILLNSEFGPMILLLIIVAVQAAVFTALILGFRKLAANKKSRLVAAKL